MSSSTDPSKRIPKSLGTDTQLLGQYSLTDLLVAGMPGVIVILVTQVVLPKSLQVAGIQVTAFTIPVAAFAIGVGALFVYLTPAYTTSIDWLEQFAGFHRSETDLGHEEAKEYTQVERILPGRDAVVRTDRSLIGAVHVDPPTMALATEAEWHTKTDAFQDFVNTTVDFPIQIYSTTQAFPADEYLQRYQDRLSDADVKQNEQLQALIQHYVDWYAQELSQRQMTIRDHYVLVAVTPHEVRFEPDGLTAKLAALPLFGLIIRAVTSPTRSEQRAAMADELDERLSQVERGLRGIEDVESTRVEAEELARVIGDFWAGQQSGQSNLSPRIRTTPFITRTDS